MNPTFTCIYNHDGVPHYVAYRLNKNNTVSWKNVPYHDIKAMISDENWQIAVLFNHESAFDWFKKQIHLWSQIAIKK